MLCRGRWVHTGPLGSHVYALGVVGFIQGGTRVRPGSRLFHLGSPGSALGDVGFILGL